MGISLSMDNSGTTIAASLAAGDTVSGSGNNAGLHQIYRYDPEIELWYQLGDTLSFGPEKGSFNTEADGIQLAGNGNIIAIQSRSYDFSDTDSNNLIMVVWLYMNIVILIKIGFNADKQYMVAIEYWGGYGAGISINDDGTILAIGSFAANSDTGKVVIYEYNTAEDNWDRFGFADSGNSDEVSQRNLFDGEAAGDFFGQSVCLNSSGDRIAISSTNASTGVLLYVYEYKSSDASYLWNQLGNTIISKNLHDNVDSIYR